MTYISDPIEQGEATAENWAFDNIKDGKFKCDCGRWVKLEDGQPSSPYPFCIPICSECFEESLEAMKKVVVKENKSV